MAMRARALCLADRALLWEKAIALMAAGWYGTKRQR
jgi:hypothetical protein